MGEVIGKLGIVMILLLGLSSQGFISNKPLGESHIDSLQQVIANQELIIRDWENHALRMKRIIGVPDTVSWSYKTKVVYPVNTKRVLRHGRNN
jgi:hypothetical protein